MPRPKIRTENFVATTVRVPLSFHKVLMGEAEQANRSLNQEILYLLRRALEAGFGETKPEISKQAPQQ